MPSMYERYWAGDCEQVWADLVKYGPAVRDDPLLPEALAVARETMGRVRHNVELVVQRLDTLGYQFVDAPVARWSPPPAETHEQLAALEALVGPVPLSIRAFYEVLGAVNLLGHHPALERRPDDAWDALPDPLVIFPLYSLIDDCRERLDDPEWDHAQPLDLALAPDILHKADISGGGPYGIYVPDASADALIREEWHETTFVNYLRVCLRWGGFPGTERMITPPLAFLASLTAGLRPF